MDNVKKNDEEGVQHTSVLLLNDGQLLAENTQSITSWINNPYIKAATSENTRKAYRSDIQHFEAWGGRLPATADRVAEYLQAYAMTLNSRTISRRLIALKHWHTYQGFPDPTQHPAIQKTMTGITRVHGKPKAKAYPLSPKDLLTITQYLLGKNSLSAIRDIALLQVGFFGAFRRSELVQIQVQHITWKDRGVDILLTHSKTDQHHEGQFCAIPNGSGLLCAVTALKKWLDLARVTQGPLFREIKKGEQLKNNPLAPASVNYIIKRRAIEAGIPNAEKLSGHSLRRGLATSATQAGATISSVMRQGRWKQVGTVMEYVDAADRFNDNAVISILKDIN